MNNTRKVLWGFILPFFFSIPSLAQDVRVELGPDQIALNQLWRITITVENERLRSYTPFPDFEEFIKRGTSSSSSTSYVNGRMTSSQSIIQNYQPTKEGRVIIPDFIVTINDKTVNVKGKIITVLPPVQQQRSQDPFDPFQDFFRRQEPIEYINVEADAFLALTTDKPSVYVGEGFVLTIAFYVAASNRADMRFYDLPAQLTEMLKKVKPANCWEENFNIDNISGEPIEIQGKRYQQFKLYQAAYYPLNTDDIEFPATQLKLIKYKQAKNPSFFGMNRQEDFETFYSKPKKVSVKNLPPHPLRDQVSVGNYRLKETISSSQLTTGQSFSYQFQVEGEGNISAIKDPFINPALPIDFYTPNIRQNIRRSSGTVRGTKNFEYYGIPNEPGKIDLSKEVFWVFFNTGKNKYDTLKSELTVLIEGESRKNEFISSNDMGSFYDIIAFEDNQLRSIKESSWLKIMTNIFIFAALALLAWFMIRKNG